VRQVGRAHEQDVDTVERRDLPGVADGQRRLDLEDADHRGIQGGDVGVGDLAQPCAARREGQAADALRRESQIGQRFLDLGHGLEPGDHDPGGARIEGSPDPEPLRRLGPDDRRRPVANRVELAHQLRLGPRAVLEVDDQPVEAGPGKQLGVDRRAAADERPEEGLSGEDPGAEGAGGRRLERHGSPRSVQRSG
jgi:hypothetical protein